MLSLLLCDLREHTCTNKISVNIQDEYADFFVQASFILFSFNYQSHTQIQADCKKVQAYIKQKYNTFYVLTLSHPSPGSEETTVTLVFSTRSALYS